MEEKTKNRNYNLDLLKILAILFVIILHYNNGDMGGLLCNTIPDSFNDFYAHFSEIIAITACNVFVLITGYFLCTNDTIKIRKIIDIINTLIFYGITIYIVSFLTNLTILDKSSFKTMLLTIDDRWFINIYILLYLIHPFINKTINNITKSQLIELIFICIFFFSIWSSIFRLDGCMNLYSFVSDGGYGITNFIMLYLIGALIRKYYDNIKIKKLLLLIIYIFNSLICTIIYLKYSQTTNYNFIINEINTVILFLLFKQLNIQKGKYITKISEC